jgi:hypothetical protein
MIARKLVQRNDERKVRCNGESNPVVKILLVTYIEIYYSDQEEIDEASVWQVEASYIVHIRRRCMGIETY